MKKYLKVMALGVVASMALQSCTDLTEPVYDKIAATSFPQTDAQLAAVVGPAYGGLRTIVSNYFNNVETSSDELLVPTRGGDWFDNGNWLNFSRHTYTSQLTPLNDMWGDIFGNIAQLNQLILLLNGNQKGIDELRAIRAYYYYLACDTWGNVPIVTSSKDANTGTQTRAQVYAFIESELLSAIPNLTTSKVYGKMTQDVGYALLAKLYLNAGVFKGSPEWQKALDATNKVINSKNAYALESNFFNNFSIANEGSKENIWAIQFDNHNAGGMNFEMRTLHYANALTYNLTAAPWNGFCTVADFYNSFDDKDARKKMWLVGQQYDAAGKPLLDAKNNPLSFKPSFSKDSYTDADADYQIAGARSVKYQVQNGNDVADQSNDFAVFRLADMYLMRAEENFRLGNTASALTDINLVRARAGVSPMTTMAAADILAERGREMAWETWRREDMIRFGTYNTARQFMTVTADKSLFPIPQPRIDVNPNIKQNPGY